MASPSEKEPAVSREGLSEYLIVLALLVLAAIGTLAIFGQDIRDLFRVPARAQSAEAPPAAASPSR